MIRAPRLLFAGTVMALVASFAVGFSGGPPGGLSGAPGENDCTVCHTSFGLNSGIAAGIATFDISGPPSMLDFAGNASLSVDFPMTTRPIHGFEITIRDGSNSPLAPANTGLLLPDGVNSSYTFGDTNYVAHTGTGNLLTSWSVGWTPPATLPAGPVTVYGVGNAANGNMGSNGDYIFSGSHSIYQARCSTVSSTWNQNASHTINLEAPTVPNHVYVLVASEDTSTVSPLGGPFTVPLNIFSPLGLLSLDPVFSVIFTDFIGVLDGSGNASATVNLPSGPGLSGVTVNFAFATFDPAGLPGVVVSEVSNAASITIN